MTTPWRVSVTGKTEELIDLAGNAMSTPVVGAAMLTALIACCKVLEKGIQVGSTRHSHSTGLTEFWIPLRSMLYKVFGVE